LLAVRWSSRYRLKARTEKERSGSKNQLVYAYCVIDGKDLKERKRSLDFDRPPASKLGLGKTYIISYQDLGAVVTKVPATGFSQEAIDRNTKDLRWLSNTATKHEALVDYVMKLTTPIPLKLCTIFKDDARVVTMLKWNYSTFSPLLRRLQRKVELGVSAYALMDVEKLAKQTEDKTIRSMQRKIATESKGRAYFLKQELDEMLTSKFATKIDSYSRDIYEELKPIAEQAKINKPIAADLGANKDQPRADMMMNAAFLVSRDQITNFERRFRELKEKYESKGILLKLTGPWPPYNFSE
jgi:hypothetical protein